jgi:hypothetical protein
MRINDEQRNETLCLRRTTILNLAAIGERIGVSRSSVQRICEGAGLGNLGLRNKTKTKPNRKPRTTSVKLSPEMATVRKRMRDYKRGASTRGLPFELTEQMCAELFTGACYYCGAEPESLSETYTRQRDSKLVAQNGIDRRDNSVGYVLGNCVSACARCNYAKGTMSETEFLAWARQLTAFQGRKESNDESH